MCGCWRVFAALAAAVAECDGEDGEGESVPCAATDVLCVAVTVCVDSEEAEHLTAAGNVTDAPVSGVTVVAAVAPDVTAASVVVELVASVDAEHAASAAVAVAAFPVHVSAAVHAAAAALNGQTQEKEPASFWVYSVSSEFLALSQMWDCWFALAGGWSDLPA